MFYNLSNKNDTLTLSVFTSEGEKVITKSHPFFDTLLNYLTTNAEHSDSEVNNLLEPGIFVSNELSKVTGRLSYEEGRITLDGLSINVALSSEIVRRIEGKDDSWDRFARFVLKVDENPSSSAQAGLYEWVTHHGINLTEDGDFVGHKGVRSTGYSEHSGPNNYINGVLYGDAGISVHVPHRVGDVISKKRGDVDDNNSLACSTGLHVGSLEYATGFAAQLLTVKVNPRDVVSVPSAESTWKIRVCRYEVISLNTDGAEFNGFTYDTEEPTVVEPTTEESSIEPEEETVTFLGYNSIAEALEDGSKFRDQVTSVLLDMEIGSTAAAQTLNLLKVHTTESSVRRWRKSNGV